MAAFKRPEQPLELYEFEGCPFCKKVPDKHMHMGYHCSISPLRHLALEMEAKSATDDSTLSPHVAYDRPQVREAISLLDLDVMVRPSPRDGVVWRPQAVEKGGKAMFPFLVDPNTGEGCMQCIYPSLVAPQSASSCDCYLKERPLIPRLIQRDEAA